MFKRVRPRKGSVALGSHTYVQDGLYTVSVNVTDKDGATGTGTSVANAAPSVAPVADQALDEGSLDETDQKTFHPGPLARWTFAAGTDLSKLDAQVKGYTFADVNAGVGPSVVASTVPEPGSALLFASGVGLTWLLLARRHTGGA